ncbi:protein of unknown function [Methylorubrum extorquens]|uniref:Uncharacterized protein n=1 Tax=Methylorubrum extorquens TaxID=408 RepID=A0A2N9AVP7_METEX|nr:protein of unknown function [Methylorubrum extorquens]
MHTVASRSNSNVPHALGELKYSDITHKIIRSSKVRECFGHNPNSVDRILKRRKFWILTYYDVRVRADVSNLFD